ncbi:putative two-component transcriptional regulator, LuxR family [Bradyrhizobium sp. ORS 375]|nr:putative two-component transcriptional regulator, LuxR family [Bradyrhizobium sp. ORS 375]
MPSILFVDDHPIYRDAVRRTLEQDIPNLAVMTAESVGSALELLKAHEVDLCLADHRLPDGDGITLLSEIKKDYPLLALGLLCAELSTSIVAAAKALGAVLCLSKDKTAAELVTAINIAFAGGQVYDAASDDREAAGLSLRRREILIHASQGLLDKQIGEKLGVTESTIRAHWARIFEQLGVANRTEAVTKALRQRLI